MLVDKRTLSRAFRARLSLTPEQADAQAERVLDLFGFEEDIIDNRLESEERQFFYALQEHGLLTTRTEETDLYNGQTWRTHYWVVRFDRVRDASRLAERADAIAAAAKDGEPVSVYQSLPAEYWTRR